MSSSFHFAKKRNHYYYEEGEGRVGGGEENVSKFGQGEEEKEKEREKGRKNRSGKFFYFISFSIAILPSLLPPFLSSFLLLIASE